MRKPSEGNLMILSDLCESSANSAVKSFLLRTFWKRVLRVTPRPTEPRLPWADLAEFRCPLSLFGWNRSWDCRSVPPVRWASESERNQSWLCRPTRSELAYRYSNRNSSRCGPRPPAFESLLSRRFALQCRRDWILFQSCESRSNDSTSAPGSPRGSASRSYC